MYIQPLYSVQCSKYRLIGEKYGIFVFQIQDIFIRMISMATAYSVNSSVRLPNHYTRAKLGKVLAITSKDIHYFIYIIYYS